MLFVTIFRTENNLTNSIVYIITPKWVHNIHCENCVGNNITASSYVSIILHGRYTKENVITLITNRI